MNHGSARATAAARALADLPSTSWIVVRGLAWSGRRLATFDHVAIGPSGVFVIATLGWPGRITIGDDVLLEHGRESKSKVRSAQAAAEAVAARLPWLRPDRVHATLCFDDAHGPSGLVADLLVCTVADIVPRLVSGPPVLSPEEVRRIAGHLRDAPTLPAGKGARQARRPQIRRPQTRRATTTRPRGREPQVPLVKAIAGVAFGVMLMTNPAVFAAVSDGVADLFADEVAPPAQEPGVPATDEKAPAGDPTSPPRRRG